MGWRNIFRRRKDDEIKNTTDTLSTETVSTENTETKNNFFQRLKSGLSKTRQGLFGKVESLLTGRTIDEELFEELEDLLIQADVGFETTMYLIDELRERAKRDKLKEGIQLKETLEQVIVSIFSENAAPLAIGDNSPAVIMVVGVNGAGKTTTIGKLGYRLKQEQAKVLFAAGDTFRAAAIEQLETWATRIGVDIIAHKEGSDPAAVAFDAVAAAKARKADVLLLDTAGRLQTKKNLMAELGKVYRVVSKELGREPDEVLLVIDATTGQNALSQARLFNEVVPLTGIVLTKLDGTAKGGIILALSHELKIPVKLVGVGEQNEDLQDFDPESFATALFSD
ncbi:MAG: signal recognition particle-docking protein FtsY [Firmicutes bacterium]|nr:signal recognition particle-docking protein FtsY [Bacillota bacterium]